MEYQENQPRPLEEGQLVNLAYQIRHIHAHRNLLAFLEEIWGNMEQIESLALYSLESMGQEQISGITVWDRHDKLLLPDLSLPFWKTQLEQVRDRTAVVLEQDLDACESDEERLQIINEYLFEQAVFKEMGLPDPKDESPFFGRKTPINTVSLQYPVVYCMEGKTQGGTA